MLIERSYKATTDEYVRISANSIYNNTARLQKATWR